jgi:hypothetical protein
MIMQPFDIPAKAHRRQVRVHIKIGFKVRSLACHPEGATRSGLILGGLFT